MVLKKVSNRCCNNCLDLQSLTILNPNEDGGFGANIITGSPVKEVFLPAGAAKNICCILVVDKDVGKLPFCLFIWRNAAPVIAEASAKAWVPL